MEIRKLLYAFLIVGVWSIVLFRRAEAQVLPVGIPELEEKYRRDQLLGKLDSTISFTVRPLTNSALRQANIFDPEGLQFIDQSKYGLLNGQVDVQFMPIVLQTQYTSDYPYGWNDGPMVPTKGFQAMFSVGVFAKYKFLSVQFRPEFVTATNSDYVGFDGTTEASWEVWYRWANNIDMPERFGNDTYNRAFWGQSSIRVNFDPISLGLSTENLWWGPGRRNSLLMSNTAPGFAHLTLNTTKPISSPIGSFEGQLVAGRLNGSGFLPLTPLEWNDHYVPKRDDWRYFSGVVLSYQPKWVPGLFLGMTRSFVRYHNESNSSLNDYLPLLGSGSAWKDLSNPDRPASAEAEKRRDQYGSIFFRWALPKGKAEFYFEYGRNDKPWDTRDLFVQLEHSRAYVMGFTKLIPIRSSIHQDMFQFNVELTQLETSRTSTQRSSPTWYVSDIVNHGYTHQGQVLGAGIGPGSNLQSADFSWFRGIKHIGLQLERLVHNNDFYYAASGDIRRNWVDFGGTLHTAWDYQNFVFTGSMTYTHAYNYQYELEENWDAINRDPNGFWDFYRRDKNNLQLRLGMMYRF